MNLSIQMQGEYWTLDEIKAHAVARVGQMPAVVLNGLALTLEFARPLRPDEAADLTAFFGALQDLPDVTEYAGKLDAIKSLAVSAVGVKLADLSAAQRNALVAALLYQAGAIDKDLKIRPLAEWLK